MSRLPVLTFISNSLTPHQQPFCQAMYRMLGENFHFIQTVPMSEERKKMGWHIEGKTPYLRLWQKDTIQCKNLLLNSDCVVSGSVSEVLLKERIRAGKLLFRYSERPLKKGVEPLKYLPRLLKWHYKNPSNKPIYMLCASGYTAGDYAKFGLFKNRTFKWGYFPATKTYNLNDLFAQKSTGRQVNILWAGRFFNWKHPQLALKTAFQLRQAGYHFSLKLIGSGPLENLLKEQTKHLGLADIVRFLGTMPPEQVRSHMEQADIYWFTSDFHEGWGAVLNESMNSGCAIVASHAIGAVPFLLQHNENGLIYENANASEFYQQTVYLIEHPQERKCLGANAYRTITEQWNAEVAAKRLIALFGAISQGKASPFNEGPCSVAIPMLQKDMYEYLRGN